MMWRPRLTAALCAAIAVTTIPAVASGAHAPRPSAPPTPSAQERLAAKALSMDRAGTTLGTGAGSSTALGKDTNDGPTPNIYDGNSFAGPDGIYYERSPFMVPGNNGTVYFGEEMDIACAVGRHYPSSIRSLAKLAATIRRTGRRVVFTIAPNKSAVNKRDLPADLPQELCDVQGIAAQDRALDDYRNPDYIQMRRKLAKEAARGVPNYWHIDTHWDTLATSKYADALAGKLSPQLGRIQSFRSGKETILVDLSFLGYLGTTYETLPARFSTTKVHISPANGSPTYDPENEIDPELAWDTKPAGRTWPGRTTLIGDSFTYRGLDSLMPLFRHGRFMWTGIAPTQSIINAIPTSDTVVIEIVQRYTPFSILTQPTFRQAVKKALHSYDRAHGGPPHAG